jgi:hypothetical protein
MYGMDVCTYSAVTDGEGLWGADYRDQMYYGEVEMLATAYDEENDTTNPSEPELRSQAQRNLSQRFPIPIEVRVPDNSAINPNSETFTFDMLVPGVKVPLMATAGCRSLRQDQKIDKVDIRQDDKGEVVTLTLLPFPGATASP